MVANLVFSTLVLAIGIAAVMVSGSRRWDRSILLMSFVPIFFGLVGSIASAYYTFVTQGSLYGAFVANQSRITQGCLAVFDPSTSQGHTPDVIEVGGRRFSYVDWYDNGGFHMTEISGGPIHADSWVRLYAVGDVIVRLDVRDHACRRAPA